MGCRLSIRFSCLAVILAKLAFSTILQCCPPAKKKVKAVKWQEYVHGIWGFLRVQICHTANGNSPNWYLDPTFYATESMGRSWFVSCQTWSKCQQKHWKVINSMFNTKECGLAFAGKVKVKDLQVPAFSSSVYKTQGWWSSSFIWRSCRMGMVQCHLYRCDIPCIARTLVAKWTLDLHSAMKPLPIWGKSWKWLGCNLKPLLALQVKSVVMSVAVRSCLSLQNSSVPVQGGNSATSWVQSPLPNP